MVTVLRRPRTERVVPAGTRAIGLLAVAAVGVLLPLGAAEACFVCFGGKETEWPWAFNLGVALLLALPPAIVGFAGFTIYRAIKRQEAAREADGR